MKILFVHPTARYAIWDVARGYRAALGRLIGDENIKDYYVDKHMAYHKLALPKEVGEDRAVLARFASELIPNNALYFGADFVFIVSGLLVHPVALFVLEQIGMPTAVLMTESPYDDEAQKHWVSHHSGAMVFTHERYSAEQNGWTYLPHAYDPAVHFPADPDPQHACDVCLVGTGWRERQLFLEQVDWSGINLRITGPLGAWPALTERSAIWPYFKDEPVNNKTIAPRYTAAKVCLNFHRRHPLAYSPNPRAYEIAACRSFQLCDPRPGVTDLFGDSVPIFDDPAKLERMVRYYLESDSERLALAAEAYRRVQAETFDVRARQFLEAVVDRFKLPWLQQEA